MALMPLAVEVREKELDGVAARSGVDVGRWQLALGVPLIGFGGTVEVRELGSCLVRELTGFIAADFEGFAVAVDAAIIAVGAAA